MEIENDTNSQNFFRWMRKVTDFEKLDETKWAAEEQKPILFHFPEKLLSFMSFAEYKNGVKRNFSIFCINKKHNDFV